MREDVLALTYTAHDMQPFAREMGYAGRPFRWDPEDRLRRRARLDARFFLLYGLSRENAEYVLDTFPIVREHEAALYGGRFGTRDLVLNYMAALEARESRRARRLLIPVARPLCPPAPPCYNRPRRRDGRAA